MRAFLIAGAFILIGAAVAVVLVKRKADEARASMQVAITRARAENVRLKAQAADLEKKLADEEALQAAAAPRAGAPRQGPATRGRQVVPLSPGLAPVDGLGNQGRASARAALMTQLWAARTGDVAGEAAALTFSAEARARLEALAATLPGDLQAEYDTPEKLMAYMLAGSPHPVGGVQVLGETAIDPNDVTVQLQWQHTDDDIVHDTTANLVLTPDGWKLVVPDTLVSRASNYLSRMVAAPAPAGH